MDIKSQKGQILNSPRPATQATHSTGQVAHDRQNRKNKKISWLIGALVIVALLVVAGYIYMSKSQIDSSKYQAVFLTNGQVYFGKLHDYYSDRPYVTDVYYIQAPAGSTAEDPSATADTTNQQLVKLGSEVHGPENKLILNKPSILFVENLTDDGKVVKLIEESKKSDE